jgi:hypothetical protein
VDYDTKSSFRYLADHGFKFAYAHTAINLQGDIEASYGIQANEFAETARESFRSSCVGYAGVHWEATETEAVESISLLYSLNAQYLPADDFGPVNTVSVRP